MNPIKDIYGVEDVNSLRNILLTTPVSEIQRRFWVRPQLVPPLVFREVGDYICSQAICLESLFADAHNFAYVLNEIAAQLIAAEEYFRNFTSYRFKTGETYVENRRFEFVSVPSDDVTPCNVDLNKGYWRFLKEGKA